MRRCRCARERTGTRCVAEDCPALAHAMAAGGRELPRGGAVGRWAAIGSPGNVHARADLRDSGDDLREAVGERAADQPLEPARDCRRSHAPRPGAEHIAALSGAFFKKEADLKPHRFRYWLTPKPDPAFDTKCADICAVYKTAAGADDTHHTVSIDEMTGIQALERIAPGLPMVMARSAAANVSMLVTGARPNVTIRSDNRNPVWNWSGFSHPVPGPRFSRNVDALTHSVLGGGLATV
jgi:hypothetical protein